MNELVLIVGLFVYVLMALVARTHFASTTWPRAALLARIPSDLGVLTFAYLMWRDRHSSATLALALGLFAASIALLLWSRATTRALRLRIAFDPEPPHTVMRDGPYRYIRHPFYTSYILFWLACAMATMHPLSLLFLFASTAFLLTAALGEERAFASSPFAMDYQAYRRTAGLMWPKLTAKDGAH
jgi:protein-S-isoprenylcysteine O-methyltransferase Ste14